jgi:hypothetical protein
VDLEIRKLLKMDEKQDGEASDEKKIVVQTPLLDVQKIATLLSLQNHETAIFGGLQATPSLDEKEPLEQHPTSSRRLIVLLRPSMIIPKEISPEN